MAGNHGGWKLKVITSRAESQGGLTKFIEPSQLERRFGGGTSP
jgi:hypothetical protein